MIELNLPQQVVASFTKMDVSDKELFPEEKILSHDFEPQRKLDFMRGRYCAHKSLSKIGQLSAVGKNADGSPIWPDKITGSISHSSILSGAIVAKKEDYSSIGLDIEVIGRIQKSLWPMLFKESEINYISKLPLSEQSIWSTVIFSLKEAYFKMVHPLTKIGLEPEDVEVDPNSNKVMIHSKRTSTLSNNSNGQILANFKIIDNSVISYVLKKNHHFPVKMTF